jgi:D-proline reductase (dithiol) PrdB
MDKTVDSYRFLEGITRRVMKQWTSLGTARETPWTPLAKPLSQCAVSLLSSAGIALTTDQPFDQGIERRDPWFSDPSYRILPRTATTGSARVYHLHINPSFAEQDLNCVMPIARLNELEALGEIGRAALSHYAYVGYTLRPEALLRHSVPDIIRHLRAEQVDAVVLVPV